VTWLALLDATVFALLGIVHVYWACGGTWGTAAAFPDQWRKREPAAGKRLRLRMHPPTPRATVAVAFALFSAAAVMLGRVGWLPFLPWRPLWTFPQWIFTLGAWVLSVLFTARAIGDFRTIGLFKSYREGRFAWWDTRLFSPLCLGIGLVAGTVAASAL
jgi:hypothetical protein